MPAEIRIFSNGNHRFANLADRIQKVTLFLFQNECDYAYVMPAGKNTDIVIHTNSATVHVEDRRIRSEHENVHGRYFVSLGPISLVRSKGVRFQARTASSSFGFDGLRLGILAPSRRTYW